MRPDCWCGMKGVVDVDQTSLLLDRPPYSIQHWPNITVALIAVAIATPFAHLVMRMNRAVLVLDAIGMGFFATSGAAKAIKVCG